jgi:hypothetical protein
MKKITLLTGLLVAAGFSSVASAHFYLGSLGTAAGATDKFYITCAANAGIAKITYTIQRTTGVQNVSAKAYSPVGALTTSAGAAYGPVITVNTGAGAKFFEVKKSPAVAGARNYRLDMHCKDANNGHDPADQSETATYIQNQ